MNTLSLSAALAALTVAGHVRLVLPGPLEGLVGSRVAIWADTTEPGRGKVGPWHYGPTNTNVDDVRWMMHNGKDGVYVPIHPGHIVGSARITGTYRVVSGDDFETPYGDEAVLGSDANPLTLCIGRPATYTDLSDQLPFLPGLKPGGHVGVLADAKPTGEMCPWCEGAGRVARAIPGVPATVCVANQPCPVCWPKKPNGEREFWNDGRAGSCDPVPHPGPPNPLGDLGRIGAIPIVPAPGGDGVDLWDWQP